LSGQSWDFKSDGPKRQDQAVSQPSIDDLFKPIGKHFCGELKSCHPAVMPSERTEPTNDCGITVAKTARKIDEVAFV
jgi:hypothetical protein